MSNLLLLTPQLPYPPHQGTSLRNFHIIKGLSGRHRITLLTFIQNEKQSEPLKKSPLLTLCREVIAVDAPHTRSKSERLRQMLMTGLPDMALRLHSRSFEQALMRTLSRRTFDFVQVEGIEMAWTIELIRQAYPNQKIIYDAHNAEALLQHRALQADRGSLRRLPAAVYSWIQQKRLRHFEVKIGEQVDWITAVSQVDKATLIEQLYPRAVPISVIPNCIDVAAYRGQPSSQVAVEVNTHFDIIFIGKMDYRPNVDAVLWFADNVWPQLLAKRQNTKWAIVGQKPHRRLDRLRNIPGITLTGWVESVHPYLAGAGVFIMPFRVGSGTRLKLIQAFAAGKAVVSTSLGVEGYPVSNGEELLIADDPDEMVSSVLLLLQDSTQRYRLGEKAQAFAEHYDWRRVIPLFDNVYTSLCQ